MFREIRRPKQLLTQAEIDDILQKGTSGVLAMTGDFTYPYAVPISFAYCGGKIYFHTAPEGYKLDCLARNNRVSFCVIAQDDVLPSGFDTLYRSVIAFGRARVLTEESERVHALHCLADKYSTNSKEEVDAKIVEHLWHVTLVEIDVEHITGKQALDLATAADC